MSAERLSFLKKETPAKWALYAVGTLVVLGFSIGLINTALAIA